MRPPGRKKQTKITIKTTTTNNKDVTPLTSVQFVAVEDVLKHLCLSNAAELSERLIRGEGAMATTVLPGPARAPG